MFAERSGEQENSRPVGRNKTKDNVIDTVNIALQRILNPAIKFFKGVCKII